MNYHKSSLLSNLEVAWYVCVPMTGVFSPWVGSGGETGEAGRQPGGSQTQLGFWQPAKRDLEYITGTSGFVFSYILALKFSLFFFFFLRFLALSFFPFFFLKYDCF